MSEGGELYINSSFIKKQKCFFLEIIREKEFVITVACQACNTVKIRLENK